MAAEIISFAGDVLLEEATLISMVSGRSMDVTNQIIGVHIFEDLFSPFISGNLILKESLDILNNLPLMGQEYLQLKIRTPTMEDKDAIQGLFYVYNITDRAFMAERNVVYKLNFVSYFALPDSNTKLSKPFEGKISDIARNILSAWVGEASIGEIEITQNATKYVSNYWPPVKNLNYIANQAISTTSSPSYLFYQNRRGFNFKSLRTLYAADSPYPKFNFNMKGREISPTGDAARNIQRDYSRMSSMDFPVGFDTLGKLGRGTYASTLYTHDLVTKKYNKLAFNYQDTFADKLHLNPFPITAKSTGFIFGPSSAILTNNAHFGVYNGYGDISNNDFMQERLSVLNMSEAMKVTIVVPGRTDYTVGQKVYLEIVQPEPQDSVDTVEGQTDKLFSGNYLVSAINHNISRENHECTMELAKDSLLRTDDTKDK